MTSSPNSQDQGYFGCAYINTAINQLVIAHRGTETALDAVVNDVSNDIQLALEGLPDQYTFVAQLFVDEVKLLFTQQFLSLDPAQYITHTGHSLGAFLAELCATRDRVKSVGFDNPGTKPQITDLVNSGEFAADSLTFVNQNMVNFLAAPDLVNTANEQVGKLYRVYSEYRPVDTKTQPDSVYYAVDFSITNQHSMKGLYEQFLPGSDMPRAYSEPTTWPTGTLVPDSGYNSYRNYDDNPNYWERYMRSRWSVENPNLLPVSLGNFADDRTLFIATELVSSLAANTQPGITITGDDSGNDIWGSTAKRDNVTSGVGNDKFHDFGGDDTYRDAGGNETYEFLPGGDHDTIEDSDKQGEIWYNGKPVSGVAKEDENNPGQRWVLRRDDGFAFIMTRTANGVQSATGTDLVVTIDEPVEGAANSITIKDFPFAQGRTQPVAVI